MDTNSKNFLFECSWEVASKVGGIHTVLITKAQRAKQFFGNNYILIGPHLDSVSNNNEFIPTEELFEGFIAFCKQKNIYLHIGYWNIPSKPMVFLVDFKQYFTNKDEIFASYWEKYKVDSLTGGWDYAEPFLFGYACAKVIEAYYQYYMDSSDKPIAQFHEWLTGAGVLYLKENVPQIATVFTTHATVLGRCLAGNNIGLYSNLESFDPNTISKQFNVVSKYSLEKLAAINSDCFTCVSQITNQECKHFFQKGVDTITPNGFDPNFIPDTKDYNQKRKLSKKKIFSILETIHCGEKEDYQRKIILNSGRYEFRNKGIDMFIDTMDKLNQSTTLKEKILAIIAVPAGHLGPKITTYLTHELQNIYTDPIINKIKQTTLTNNIKDKVNIIFIPCYLNGQDGLINMDYFDFLLGSDLTIFPSYYEPWGYTPMESLFFGISSITTSLAGFGLWVKDNIAQQNCLNVIDRADDNYDLAVEQIVDKVEQIINADNDYLLSLQQDCKRVSSMVEWNKLYDYYLKAYDIALGKAGKRLNLFANKKPLNIDNNYKTMWGDKPLWRKFLVRTTLPNSLQKLNTLSQNLWWSWNNSAKELFAYIDKERFTLVGYNPIKLINSLTQEDFNRLEHDDVFLTKLNSVYSEYESYMSDRKDKKSSPICYLSMEFGIDDSLQIFSGGLGMLAGDYLKQASDSNENIIGVGLLYRQGYFSQHITKDGQQESKKIIQHFSTLPLHAVRDKDGLWQKIAIDFPTGKVYAKIWLVNVGATKLYLLDTDTSVNSEQDRLITYSLYGGDNLMRLKQEMLLGIGAVKMLSLLNIHPVLYHLNEGHSAFCSVQRLINYINNDKLSFDQSMVLVRSTTLFTTHTPVAAGHDMFEKDIIRQYFSQYISALKISWQEFMHLGCKTEDKNEKFSVSVLAINTSDNCQGVSRIHGRVSRQMFKYLYDNYFAQEINIGYVTNGVHFPTWVSKEFKQVYDNYFDKKYISEQSNENYWQKIYDVPNDIILSTHQKLKTKLINFVLERLKTELSLRGEDPSLYVNIASTLNDKKLTIGFARRFATYKRANLIFTDLDKLQAIVNKGVQFIFAGKAHPNDKQGQELIKRIINISKQPEFVGKIVFIENYDMNVAKHLVSGVDIWLNTPKRPLEASGTSGEKAIMNGVINFSVLDGWWAEGYRQTAGWALEEIPSYKDDNLQDIYDSQMIYTILEQEIIPTFYNQNKKASWVDYIKNTIAQIAPHYTMQRQMEDYFSLYYNHMFERTKLLTNNNNELLKQYALFKQKIMNSFSTIELISLEIPDTETQHFTIGDRFVATVILNTCEISPENIGVEMLITHKNSNEQIDSIDSVEQFNLISSQNNKAVYKLDIVLSTCLVGDYAFRVYPKHPLMPHRTDIPLVKWI